MDAIFWFFFRTVVVREYRNRCTTRYLTVDVFDGGRTNYDKNRKR